MNKNKSFFGSFLEWSSYLIGMIFCFLTFSFLDRIIKNKIKQYVHSKRDAHVKKAREKFQQRYPKYQAIQSFEKELYAEVVRVYPMIDKSILLERIKRARWESIAFGLVMAIYFGTEDILRNKKESEQLLHPVVTMIISTALKWVISIATIPLAYELRVKGAMKSITAKYIFSNGLLERPIFAEQPEMVHPDLQENVTSTDRVMRGLRANSSGSHHKKDELMPLLFEEKEERRSVDVPRSSFGYGSIGGIERETIGINVSDCDFVVIDVKEDLITTRESDVNTLHYYRV